MPSHPIQFLIAAVVGGGGDLIKKTYLGVSTGVVNSGGCRGRILWGGGDGNESMMAATGIERRTKENGRQQQLTAVYCGGRQRMSKTAAEGGRYRRKVAEGRGDLTEGSGGVSWRIKSII
jgi:hypothetical protein